MFNSLLRKADISRSGTESPCHHKGASGLASQHLPRRLHTAVSSASEAAECQDNAGQHSLKRCKKLLVALQPTSSKETILFFRALNNRTIDTFSISRVILTGFWNPTSCAWLLGFTAASWLPAMASGMMVGFKTAFFSFRLRTKPSSGKGKQEGLLRPKSVTYRSTAPHRSLQSCAAPRGKRQGHQVRVHIHPHISTRPEPAPRQGKRIRTAKRGRLLTWAPGASPLL